MNNLMTLKAKYEHQRDLAKKMELVSKEKLLHAIQDENEIEISSASAEYCYWLNTSNSCKELLDEINSLLQIAEVSKIKGA